MERQFVIHQLLVRQGIRTLLEMDARLVAPTRKLLDRYLFADQVKLIDRIGALVLHTPPELDGREIEVSPLGGTPADRSGGTPREKSADCLTLPPFINQIATSPLVTSRQTMSALPSPRSDRQTV